MALKTSFPLSNRQASTGGPRGLPLAFIFAGAVAQPFDFTLEQEQCVLDFVQSVYIDNLANGNVFDLTFAPMGYSIRVKANQQGLYPVICGPGPVRGSALLAGAGTVKCIFTNTEYNYAQWGI